MSIRHLLSALALATLLAAMRAQAQGTRSAMVDSAQALINDFEEPRSIVVLRRALDPTLGAPDASWTRAVQLLAQTLLQTNQRDEAVAWLRWAHRMSPSLPVDSINFTPTLVTALLEARAFVATNRAEPRVSVQHTWSTATPPGGFGDVQVVRGAGDRAIPLQLSVNGELVDEGQTRRLAPGSYRIVARAAGRPDVDLTTEVLPGVTTLITVGLVIATEELSEAIVARVAARLARVDVPSSSGAACRVGYFAGGPRLLITRYGALGGRTQLAVRPVDSRVASEQIRELAAFDTNSDLAVLSLTGAPVDSLGAAVELPAGASLWAAHFPACGATPSLTRVAVASVSGDAITLTQDAAGADQSAVLVDATGAVAGLLTGPRSARTLRGAATVLDSARANVARRALLAVQSDPQPSPPAQILPDTPRATRGRSKLLPIGGGVVVGGLVAWLATRGGDVVPPPTTGGIVIRLPQ